MKKVILSFLIALVSIAYTNVASAQIETGAKIEFKKETHDYGTVKFGD